MKFTLNLLLIAGLIACISAAPFEDSKPNEFLAADEGKENTPEELQDTVQDEKEGDNKLSDEPLTGDQDDEPAVDEEENDEGMKLITIEP